MTESQTVEGPSTTAEDAVEIEKIVPKPLDKVWECLLTEAGIEALLGEGARLGTKGEPWHAADGTYGVTRSYHPLEQVRVSWHADADAPATMVDLQLSEHPEGTRLWLRHEHLTDDLSREDLRVRWVAALDRFAAL